MSPTDPDLTGDLATALVHFAPDGLLVSDEDGVIVTVNQRLCDIFGYERSELIGESVERLVPEQLRQVHRAHRTRFGADPATRVMGVGRNLAGRRRDGSEVAIEIGLSPVPVDDGFRVLAIVRDVTEQVALRARADLVQRTIDAMREGVFMFDPKSLRFGYVNEGAVDQTRYERDDLLAMTPLHLLPEYSEPAFRDLLRPLLDGSTLTVAVETVHRRRDGVDLPVALLLQYPEVDAPDGERAVAVIARDISERKAADEIRERYESQTALISDLRLRLLSGRPLAETLHALCMEIRESGLAADAFILERAGDGKVSAWGSAASPGVVELQGGGASEAMTSPGADAFAPVALRAGGGHANGDEQLLATFDADAMVIGALGRERAMAVAYRGERSSADLEVLTRLVVEVGEAVERAAARADQHRLGVLEDRERIATDLHDLVIQRLFAAGMRLQATMATVDGALRDRLSDVVTELDTTIAEIRDTIFALQSSGSDAERPAELVAQVVSENVDYLGFTPALHVDPRVGEVPETVTDQLGPVLTELLSNVARHANATRAEVTVTAAGGRLTVSVVDDGQGYDPTAARGQGLDNLARRAADRGGGFSVEANPDGRGTTARWWVPIRH